MIYLLMIGVLTIGLLIVSGIQVSRSRRRWPALGVLDERYARGDINREEYLRKRRDIIETGDLD